MLPTSSYSSRAASASVAGPGLPCTGPPTRPRMLLIMVPTVLLLLLFLPGVVLGDYENTWNSYYEQPCCGGTTNGPFHLRHHGASASVAGPGLPCTGPPTRPRMLLIMVPTVLLLLLFLPGVVLGDYENTWNSYYEQPCCGGTTNGPFHLRHHGAGPA
uniref:Uncharacterized protein n=1 Tax=Anopheles minimus TaxID=112268 RepID=A0A182WBN0_9DIPT